MLFREIIQYLSNNQAESEVNDSQESETLESTDKGSMKQPLALCKGTG